MPLQATSGAASYDAFGGGVPVVPNYIEDVFQTWLYTGNGSTQTITNGIDLAGKGGLTWLKSRSAATNNFLFDTTRGALNEINSNTTEAQASLANSLTAFNSNGFSLGSAAGINVNAATYASWTFREQSKFFDVVTYTGDGVNNRAIAHSLTSAPGCIIVKRTSSSNDWRVYHRSMGSPAQNYFMSLNATQAAFDTSVATMWPSAPTSTAFFVSDQSEVNASGSTYVAYLFAHNAGGFGLTGTDNVISCGSFTTTGAVVNVTLGYEPQFLLVKRTDGVDDWRIIDNMRGFSADKDDQILYPNSSAAEVNLNPYIGPTATGFSTAAITTGRTYIYIAIRRGPMKVPTTGTSVFAPVIGNASSSAPFTTFNTSFTVDGTIYQARTGSTGYEESRLQGNGRYLQTASTAAELTTGVVVWDRQTGVGSTSSINLSDYIGWMYRRAPGFFDVVCYTGTGSARTVAHNLAAVPELIIVKRRSGIAGWPIYSAPTGINKLLFLNLTDAEQGDPSNTYWNNTLPTTSVFSLGSNVPNASAQTYVAYLFATCPGVSKVGSYTGTGTTQAIACGFTGGARFVLIKRTDSTGDWYVWDSARGIVAGNDPYLLLNSTAAQVTGTDYIDTSATGFEISSTAPAAINASGGTFVFLAIA